MNYHDPEYLAALPVAELSKLVMSGEVSPNDARRALALPPIDIEVRNRGMLRVPLSVLDRVLHIPEGHRIVGTRPSDDFMDSVDILVEGPTLPTVHAHELTPRIQLIITSIETETMVSERTLSGKFEK
jgi:hypothetical protein